MGLLAKNWGKIIFVLALLIGGWLVYDNFDWINANFLHLYKNVPNLSLQDYLEKNHALSEFGGKPLIINLWHSDSPFSDDELRDLASMQRELGERVTIIAINRGESLDRAKGFTDRLGVTTHLYFFLDPKDSFYKAIGGFQMPETLFVDKNGKIVDHKRGHMQLNEIRQRLERIL